MKHPIWAAAMILAGTFMNAVAIWRADRSAKTKWEKDPVKEWEKRGLDLEKQGIEISVIGRYPKPGFGMPRESDKR